MRRSSFDNCGSALLSKQYLIWYTSCGDALRLICRLEGRSRVSYPIMSISHLLPYSVISVLIYFKTILPELWSLLCSYNTSGSLVCNTHPAVVCNRTPLSILWSFTYISRKTCKNKPSCCMKVRWAVRHVNRVEMLFLLSLESLVFPLLLEIWGQT